MGRIERDRASGARRASWARESGVGFGDAVLITPDGSRMSVSETIQREHAASLYVNGEHVLRVVCSPDHLMDLVYGRLLTEGVISSASDVRFASMSKGGADVRVFLREGVLGGAGDGVPTLATTGSCDSGFRRLSDTASLRPVIPVEWDPSWVFDLARRLAEDTPMHRRTFGAHSCFLSVAGEYACCREDLGRHNAFDKVVGHAMQKGLDLSQAVVFSSGRVPVDMVTKAIRAGVPVLATKAVPTDRTVELARKYDLTLICSARPDSMKVFNDPLLDRGRRVAAACSQG